MSIAYHDLLGATIEHLQELKRKGRRFIAVDSETLEALKSPVPIGTQDSFSPAVLASPSFDPTAIYSPAAGPETAVPEKFTNNAPETTSIKSSTSLSPEEKLGAINALRQRVVACVECKHLVAGRHNVVFGVGDVNARLMFVGEAPGAEEDAQGEPFVGAAGKLLTKIIETMGLSREQVYIGNILKCRPDTPGQAFGNRKPTPAEMKTCVHWLEDQIDIIQPEVLVALGATAVEGLLGSCFGISKMRGHWHEYRKIPLMPTFHPSFLLRSTSLSDKRKVWEDMLQVLTKLGMPISEKQQNYYLKTLNARNAQ